VRPAPGACGSSNEFDRDRLLVLVVGTFGKVDGTHPPAAEQESDPVRADPRPAGNLCFVQETSDRLLIAALNLIVVGGTREQQRHYLLAQCHVVLALLQQELFARLRSEGQGALEYLLQSPPALRGELCQSGAEPT
jgi:hypothetical protein